MIWTPSPESHEGSIVRPPEVEASARIRCGAEAAARA